ncbi:hypothetical protein VDGL01_10130 [Verticillium dahliae]
MRKIARADEGVAQYLGVIYAEPLKSERNNPVERTRRKPLVAGCLTHSSLELQGALVGRSPTTMVGRGMAVSGAKVFHLDVGYKALRPKAVVQSTGEYEDAGMHHGWSWLDVADPESRRPGNKRVAKR